MSGWGVGTEEGRSASTDTDSRLLDFEGGRRDGGRKEMERGTVLKYFSKSA